MTTEGDVAFEAALDDCIRRLRAGESLARCLAGHPAEWRDDLARLAPLAVRLDRLVVAPSPAFQASLETRLRAAVEVERQVRQRRAPSRVGWLFASAPARMIVIALITSLVLASGGVGVLRAADDSLPDSPLYGVKEAREATALWLARDDEARAGVLLGQLGERGRELGEAIRRNRPRPVVDLLAWRVAETTERIVDRALELQARGAREPARRALILIRTLQRQVERATAQAPAGSQPALRQLNQVLDRQERRLIERIGRQ